MSALLASPVLILQLTGLWPRLLGPWALAGPAVLPALVSGLGGVLAPWSPACLFSARQRGYGAWGPAGIGVLLHLNGSALGPGLDPQLPSLSSPLSLPFPPHLCIPHAFPLSPAMFERRGAF